MKPADSDDCAGAPSALCVLAYVIAALIISVVLLAYPILVPSAIATVVVGIFLREQNNTVTEDSLTEVETASKPPSSS